jgi:hypothetical protein
MDASSAGQLLTLAKKRLRLVKHKQIKDVDTSDAKTPPDTISGLPYATVAKRYFYFVPPLLVVCTCPVFIWSGLLAQERSSSFRA